jgi:hypothetical protein
VFPVGDVRSPIRCPFCANHFGLSLEQLAELAGYQASVQAAFSHAGREHQLRVQWEQRAERESSPLWPLVGFLVGLGALLVVILALRQGVSAGLLPEGLAAAGTGVVFLGFMAGLLALIGWPIVTGRRLGVRPALHTTRVACPSCGAPNELHPGQTLEVCRYCRSALVPSRTIMQHVADAARITARAAEIARYRSERSAMLVKMRGMHAAGGYAVGAGVLSGFFTVITVSSAIRVGYGNPDIPLLAIAATAAPALICLGIAGLMFDRQRRRKDSYLSAMADLARQFGGEPIRDLAGVIAWLNAYWAAPYEIVDLGTGPSHVAAALAPGGYAALVDVVPWVPHGYRPRVLVLIAADVPEAALRGHAVSPDAAQASWQWLSQAGFAVTVGRSGVIARARGPAHDFLANSPESLHLLATVLTTLIGYARGIGAEPVAPLSAS